MKYSGVGSVAPCLRRSALAASPLPLPLLPRLTLAIVPAAPATVAKPAVEEVKVAQVGDEESHRTSIDRRGCMEGIVCQESEDSCLPKSVSPFLSLFLSVSNRNTRCLFMQMLLPPHSSQPAAHEMPTSSFASVGASMCNGKWSRQYQIITNSFRGAHFFCVSLSADPLMLPPSEL